MAKIWVRGDFADPMTRLREVDDPPDVNPALAKIGSGPRPQQPKGSSWGSHHAVAEDPP